MQSLYQHSKTRLLGITNKFVRYLYEKIEWNDRLIGITGARGTGKTTLILQYIKNTYGNSDKVLYVSLDDFYFTKYRLFNLAERFYQNGGRHLFIDEVHKYPYWDMEIKNLYDTYPSLKIVFSGSSALQLHKAKADLSRRAAMYHLHEMSFREYLNLALRTNYTAFTLEEILRNYDRIIPDIIKDKSILPLFNNYLKKGVYPFFIEAKGQFHERLVNIVNVIIENDLPAIERINYETAYKLRKVISLVADSVPFKINISGLSRKSGLSRDVLLRMLHSLDKANLVIAIKQKGAPTGHLTKPDKLYLNNPALLYALCTREENQTGTLRETFFASQLILKHKVNAAPEGDFLIDGKYVFEIGGKNKKPEQIAGIEQAYIAADDIEFGYRNKIPLWLFGFLY